MTLLSLSSHHPGQRNCLSKRMPWRFIWSEIFQFVQKWVSEKKLSIFFPLGRGRKFPFVHANSLVQNSVSVGIQMNAHARDRRTLRVAGTGRRTRTGPRRLREMMACSPEWAPRPRAVPRPPRRAVTGGARGTALAPAWVPGAPAPPCPSSPPPPAAAGRSPGAAAAENSGKSFHL